MKRNSLIVLAPLLIIIYFYKKKDDGIRSGFIKEPRTTLLRDAPITLKNSAIRKVASKAVVPSSPTESNLETAQLDESEFESYKSLQFPSGVLSERKILDDTAFVEIFKTNSGDTVTLIYNNGLLTSEKWESQPGKSMIRSSFEREDFCRLRREQRSNHYSLL